MRTVSFAENLKRIRKEKGVTASRLAEAIGTDDCVIYNWESGHRSPGMWSIVKLCDALGCSADELLFGGSDP